MKRQTIYFKNDKTIIAHDVAEVTAALRAARFSSELEFYKVVLKGDAL
jgi:hypothetical protein